MIFYKNTKAMVRSRDGDSDFFDNVTGVLQGDTLAPFQLIICQDLTLTKARNVCLSETIIMPNTHMINSSCKYICSGRISAV